MIKPLKIVVGPNCNLHKKRGLHGLPLIIFSAEIIKADHKAFKKNLVLHKYMFWLNYEYFPVLCDIFLPKIVILQNSCARTGALVVVNGRTWVTVRN